MTYSDSNCCVTAVTAVSVLKCHSPSGSESVIPSLGAFVPLSLHQTQELFCARYGLQRLLSNDAAQGGVRWMHVTRSRAELCTWKHCRLCTSIARLKHLVLAHPVWGCILCGSH